MDQINIGIIDDDWQTNPLSIKIANTMLKKTGKSIELRLIMLEDDIDEMINLIISEKCDGLIIDQKLNSKLPGINYSGTDITEKLNKIKDIPYSFWTSNPEGAADKCNSNEVDRVYDHEVSEENNSLINTSMFKNLILKIKKYRNEIEGKEKRLMNLLVIKEPSQEEITEIDSLDEAIERSILKTSPLNKEARNLKIEKINQAIDAFFEKFGNGEKC